MRITLYPVIGSIHGTTLKSPRGCLGAIIVYKKEVMQELVQLIRKCFNYMDDCDCVLSKQSCGQIVQHRPVQILDTIRSIQ